MMILKILLTKYNKNGWNIIRKLVVPLTFCPFMNNPKDDNTAIANNIKAKTLKK